MSTKTANPTNADEHDGNTVPSGDGSKSETPLHGTTPASLLHEGSSPPSDSKRHDDQEEPSRHPSAPGVRNSSENLSTPLSTHSNDPKVPSPPFTPTPASPFPSSAPLHFFENHRPASTHEQHILSPSNLTLSSPSGIEMVEYLMNLYALHQKGGLTEEEFVLAKQRLLQSSPSHLFSQRNPSVSMGNLRQRRRSSSMRSSRYFHGSFEEMASKEGIERLEGHSGARRSRRHRRRSHTDGSSRHHRRSTYRPHSLPLCPPRRTSLQSRCEASKGDVDLTKPGEHNEEEKRGWSNDKPHRRRSSVEDRESPRSSVVSSKLSASHSRSSSSSSSASSSSGRSRSSSSSSSERFMVLPKSRVWKGLEVESSGDPFSRPHSPAPTWTGKGESWNQIGGGYSISELPSTHDVGGYHAVMMDGAENPTEKRWGSWKMLERVPLLHSYGEEEGRRGEKMGETTYESTSGSSSAVPSASTLPTSVRKAGLRFNLPKEEGEVGGSTDKGVEATEPYGLHSQLLHGSSATYTEEDDSKHNKKLSGSAHRASSPSRWRGDGRFPGGREGGVSSPASATIGARSKDWWWWGGGGRGEVWSDPFADFRHKRSVHASRRDTTGGGAAGVENKQRGKLAKEAVVELENEDEVKVHYFNSRGATGKNFSEVVLRPEQLRAPTYLRKSKLERPAHLSQSLIGVSTSITSSGGNASNERERPSISQVMSPTDLMFASVTGEMCGSDAVQGSSIGPSFTKAFTTNENKERKCGAEENPCDHDPSEVHHDDLGDDPAVSNGTLTATSPEGKDTVSNEVKEKKAELPFSPVENHHHHHHHHHRHRSFSNSSLHGDAPPTFSPHNIPQNDSGGSGSSKISGTSSFLEQSLNWYWIDVTGKDPSEKQYHRVIRALTKKFNLCESFLVDREHLLVLPQVCESPTHPGQYLLNLRVSSHRVSLADDNAQLLTNRWIILIDLNRAVIITLHRVDTRSMALLRQRWKKVFHHASVEVSFQEFLLKIIDDAIHTYQLSLDVHEELLDRCELRLFSRAVHTQWGGWKSGGSAGGFSLSRAGEQNEAMNEKIFSHFGDSASSSFLRQLLDPKSTRKLPKDEINSFLHHLHRRTSVQLRMLNLTIPVLAEGFTKLELCSKELSAQMTSTCRELSDRALEIRDDGKTLLDLHLSLQSFHTNELMAVLTRLSLFFTPCTFLAGVYGMNFQYFPELHWGLGYAYFWGLCVILVLAMHIFFLRYQ